MNSGRQNDEDTYLICPDPSSFEGFWWWSVRYGCVRVWVREGETETGKARGKERERGRSCVVQINPHPSFHPNQLYQKSISNKIPSNQCYFQNNVTYLRTLMSNKGNSVISHSRQKYLRDGLWQSPLLIEFRPRNSHNQINQLILVK